MGNRAAVRVAQQLPVGRGVPLLAVLEGAGRQSGGDRLPADRLALLPQQDQALLRIQILRAAGPVRRRGGGLGMQAEYQRVQLRVIARGRSDLVDLGKSVVWQRAAGGRQAPRPGHLARRVVGPDDQPVVHTALVQAAQRGHRCSSALRLPRVLRRRTTWVLM
jgi:hypothetical protein